MLALNGRIVIGYEPAIWIRQALARGVTSEAALTHEVAFYSQTIRLLHTDPADRLIVATALVNGFKPATADEHWLKFRGSAPFRTADSR